METVRQKIISDESVKGLMNQGPDLVERVREVHLSVSSAEKILADFVINGIKSTQERLDEIAGAVAYEVSLDGTLSNDAKRKAAAAKLLAENEDYKKLTADLRSLQARKLNLEQQVQIAKIQLETARNTLSMWHTEMSVIAGLSREVAQSNIQSQE